MTNEDGKHNVGEDTNSTSRKHMARTKSGLLRGRPHTMPAWELYSLGLIYILCICCQRKLLQLDLSGLDSYQNHTWVNAGLTFVNELMCCCTTSTPPNSMSLSRCWICCLVETQKSYAAIWNRGQNMTPDGWLWQKGIVVTNIAY